VSLGGEPVARTPLIVLSPVADGGAWARLRDGLSALIE
jgi:hypothetical protein